MTSSPAVATAGSTSAPALAPASSAAKSKFSQSTSSLASRAATGAAPSPPAASSLAAFGPMGRLRRSQAGGRTLKSVSSSPGHAMVLVLRYVSDISPASGSSQLAGTRCVMYVLLHIKSPMKSCVSMSGVRMWRSFFHAGRRVVMSSRSSYTALSVSRMNCPSRPVNSFQNPLRSSSSGSL